MAFDFSKLNFFSRLDARARVAVLFGGVIGVGTIVYFVVNSFSSGGSALGPSRVASAPASLQSVPGGSNLRPEYQRVLLESSKQIAKTAQMTGGSAVPTLVNLSAPGSGTANCNVICSDQLANVKPTLDDWVSKGQLSSDVSAQLQALANNNVPLADYAEALNQLVKDGKLTPEQARELLEQYKKQAASVKLQESAKVMDDLIKTGTLPLDAANELLTLQKQSKSPTDYASALQQMVREGKLTPEVAQQLLTQYTQQHAKSVIEGSIAILKQMAKHGELIPEVLNELIPLEEKMVPVSEFSAVLKKQMDAGKLIPLVADKILAEFKQQKAAIGQTGEMNQIVQKAEQNAIDRLKSLSGKLDPEVLRVLMDLIARGVSYDEYATQVNKFVQENKIPPDLAKQILDDYRALLASRVMADKLNNLQANNANTTDYANALREAVANGALTAEQAAELMRQYAATRFDALPTTPGATPEFTKLQEAVSQGSGAAVTADQFAAPSTGLPSSEMSMEDLQASQARIESLMTAMGAQAGQMVNTWQNVPPQLYRAGQDQTAQPKAEGGRPGAEATAGTSTAQSKQAAPSAPIVIKAGSILFAVLDTAVNSDYPDTPVLATIVDGPLKGSKLLGKLTTTKGVSGQLDRVSLNFTLMNNDDWDKSKTVTAFAIDPDTARTVLASQVDYHYLQRFGAIMATSFVQGYANAISSSSSTTTTGIFGTSTTHPELSPSQKLATAIGQIGQSLGSVTQNYVNIPPTVKVDSGVGLGILFMADVS